MMQTLIQLAFFSSLLFTNPQSNNCQVATSTTVESSTASTTDNTTLSTYEETKSSSTKNETITTSTEKEAATSSTENEKKIGEQTTSTFHHDTTSGEKQSTTINVAKAVGIIMFFAAVIALAIVLMILCRENRKLRKRLSNNEEQPRKDDEVIEPHCSEATESSGRSVRQRQSNKSLNFHNERVAQELTSDDSCAASFNGNHLEGNSYVNFHKELPGIFRGDRKQPGGSQDDTEMSDGKLAADQRHTGQDKKQSSTKSQVVDELNKREQVRYVNQTNPPVGVEQDYMIPDVVQDKSVYLDFCDVNGATQSGNNATVHGFVYEDLR